MKVTIERGWQAKARQQPEYDAGLKRKTLEVHAAAKEIAPTGAHHGYYRRRLKVSGTKVLATDAFWHLVEFGSVNNPPYAVLRRAAIAVGLRLMPSPKK